MDSEFDLNENWIHKLHNVLFRASETEYQLLHNLTTVSRYGIGGRLGVYASIAIVSSLAMFVAIVLMAMASCRASEIMHKSLLLNILRSPMSFFDTTPLGRILNRFGKVKSYLR